MKCPIDSTPLEQIDYEGIHIETCPSCGGEWLDAGELAHINEAREKRFDPDEIKALANTEPMHGLPLEAIDRVVPCPKCGTETDPVHYGGDTGIVIESCPLCGGIWLDAAELEAIQGLIEAWEAQLPQDIKQQRKLLNKIEADLDAADDVHYSRFGPLNLLVNGIIDKLIMK